MPSERSEPLEGAATKPVAAPATNREAALLTGVRATSEDGFDRVVFEFRDGSPGYDVRYSERPVLQDGSGSEVAVKGASVLLVRMENALDADLSDESAPLTYKGPIRLSPDTQAVAELARVGGFEGVLTWAVGLTGRSPFRVRTAEDPARLVVDFAAR